MAINIPGGYNIQPPAGVPSAGNVTSNAFPAIVTLLFGAAILLALFFLIFAGIQWMTSGGDKQKISAAREKIIFAIVGLLVVLLAYLVITFVMNFFGITLDTSFNIQ